MRHYELSPEGIVWHAQSSTVMHMAASRTSQLQQRQPLAVPPCGGSVVYLFYIRFHLAPARHHRSRLFASNEERLHFCVPFCANVDA